MEPTPEQIREWHNDANNWKWGVFYYNKKDPRVMVDKRNPNYGATVNWAQRRSYGFLIGMGLFFGLVTLTILLAKR